MVDDEPSNKGLKSLKRFEKLEHLQSNIDRLKNSIRHEKITVDEYSRLISDKTSENIQQAVYKILEESNERIRILEKKLDKYQKQMDDMEVKQACFNESNAVEQGVMLPIDFRGSVSKVRNYSNAVQLKKPEIDANLVLSEDNSSVSVPNDFRIAKSRSWYSLNKIQVALSMIKNFPHYNRLSSSDCSDNLAVFTDSDDGKDRKIDHDHFRIASSWV